MTTTKRVQKPSPSSDVGPALPSGPRGAGPVVDPTRGPDTDSRGVVQ